MVLVILMVLFMRGATARRSGCHCFPGSTHSLHSHAFRRKYLFTLGTFPQFGVSPPIADGSKMDQWLYFTLYLFLLGMPGLHKSSTSSPWKPCSTSSTWKPCVTWFPGGIEEVNRFIRLLSSRVPGDLCWPDSKVTLAFRNLTLSLWLWTHYCISMRFYIRWFRPQSMFLQLLVSSVAILVSRAACVTDIAFTLCLMITGDIEWRGTK